MKLYTSLLALALALALNIFNIPRRMKFTYWKKFSGMPPIVKKAKRFSVQAESRVMITKPALRLRMDCTIATPTGTGAGNETCSDTGIDTATGPGTGPGIAGCCCTSKGARSSAWEMKGRVLEW